ncbi:MAG: aminopeptidase P family N-terminal domain-containing protein, partial [Marivivens sp.]
MFQSFESTSSPEQGPARLAALRAEIASEGLAGFIVPRADAHQGEYVAPCDARLAWLSGFTGSAGFCAVLPEIAGVFVDGRYRLQVRSQVALEAFTPVDWPEVSLADWLIEHLPEGGEVGFDPWLHSVDEVTKLRAKLTPKRITLTPIANLVDRIWDDRPAPPSAPFEVYPVDYAGEAHEAKLARLGKVLEDGTCSGPFGKVTAEVADAATAMGAKAGDLVLVGAGDFHRVNAGIGRLRVHVAKERELIPSGLFKFCWV